jgi:hypothetical protein
MSRDPHRPPRPALLLLAAFLLAALVAGVAACTGDDSSSAPTSSSVISVPPAVELGEPVTVPTMSVPPGFVAPDTRGAALLPVESRPNSTPPIPVYGGTARISGVVQGPEGPVPGATVLLERFVGRRSGSEVVTAGPDGRFTAVDLLGGLYRVRGWLVPSFTAPSSVTLFLAADQTDTELRIDVRRYDTRKLQAGVETAGVTVGATTRLRALLTQDVVDDDGIVVSSGVAGEVVTVATDAGYSAASTEATTDADGYAVFTLTCLTVGTHGVTVTASGSAATVALPPCGPRVTTTTSTTPSTPPADAVPVGASIGVPYGGTLPAGAYRTGETGCSTSFQVWRDGQWQADRVTAGAVIEAAAPIRDLQPTPGGTGCRYERVR